MSFTINAIHSTANNRRLQRKQNRGFKDTGLPTAAVSGNVLPPVSPFLAEQFRQETARASRRQHLVQILALIAVGAVATAILLMANGLL